MGHHSNAANANFCSALGWTGETAPRPLLPTLALRYFIYALLALGAGVALTEGALRYLASQRTVVSNAWAIENDTINQMNQQKVLGSATDPIWHSAGIPIGQRSPGVGRILVIGDSFVWGDGYLNANDIWWRQLERELRHRGYPGVEVVAAGRNGASTQQQLEWLRDPGFLPTIQPDAVILGYVTNDPDVRGPDGRYLVRQFGRDVPLPTWTALDATLGQVAPTLAAQIKPKLTAKWASEQTDTYAYDTWELKILESPNIEAYGRIVQELADLLRSDDRPAFVVTLPNRPDPDAFAPRYRPVEPLFAAAGLPFVNLLDEFVREYPETNGLISPSALQWGVNPANAHPAPTATRFYARQVADILEHSVPQTLGERRQASGLLVPKLNDWMPPAAAVVATAPGQWRLLYPGPDALAPRQPLDTPHVMLAFELPVAIRKVRLSGERLASARLWFTAVDPGTGVDRGNPIGGEVRRGAAVEWDLGGKVGADAVNTLRIAADVAAQRVDRSIEPGPDAISQWGGHAFVFAATDLHTEADDDIHPTRSAWILLENGVPLKPAHAQHADIATAGAGRWSHWKGQVVFSASDNSHPKKNGRRYALVSYPTEPNALQLQIEFDEVAVRP